jgi:Uma2 family endonuclease
MSNQAILPPREDGFARKKWNVQECRFLTESGLLEPGKYELIEGEIVFKMGQSRLHIAIINKIIFLLAAIFGQESIQNQAQIGIGERDEFNDPEPDVAVLRGSVDDYLEREPDPANEVLLLVEVSNSSLKGDTTVKAQIYARHGLPEYWVVAIPNRELIVYRQPTADGYASVQTYRENDSFTPLAAPTASVCLADMLP